MPGGQGRRKMHVPDTAGERPGGKAMGAGYPALRQGWASRGWQWFPPQDGPQEQAFKSFGVF